MASECGPTPGDGLPAGFMGFVRFVDSRDGDAGVGGVERPRHG